MNTTLNPEIREIIDAVHYRPALPTRSKLQQTRQKESCTNIILKSNASSSWKNSGI
jgi:hypothetical protein